MRPESSSAIPRGLLQEGMRDREMLSQILGIRDKCLDIVSKYGVDKRNSLEDRVLFWMDLHFPFRSKEPVKRSFSLAPDDFASFRTIRTVDASVPLGDGLISSKVKIESFEKGNPRESKYIRVSVYSDRSLNPSDLNSLIVLIDKDGNARIRKSRFENVQAIGEISKVVLAIDGRVTQASSSSANR